MSVTAISPETTTVSAVLTLTQKPIQELFRDLFVKLVDEDTVKETLKPKMVYIKGRPKI